MPSTLSKIWHALSKIRPLLDYGISPVHQPRPRSITPRIGIPFAAAMAADACSWQNRINMHNHLSCDWGHGSAIDIYVRHCLEWTWTPTCAYTCNLWHCPAVCSTPADTVKSHEYLFIVIVSSVTCDLVADFPGWRISGYPWKLNSTNPSGVRPKLENLEVRKYKMNLHILIFVKRQSHTNVGFNRLREKWGYYYTGAYGCFIHDTWRQPYRIQACTQRGSWHNVRAIRDVIRVGVDAFNRKHQAILFRGCCDSQRRYFRFVMNRPGLDPIIYLYSFAESLICNLYEIILHIYFSSNLCEFIRFSGRRWSDFSIAISIYLEMRKAVRRIKCE